MERISSYGMGHDGNCAVIVWEREHPFAFWTPPEELDHMPECTCGYSDALAAWPHTPPYGLSALDPDSP